MSLYTQNEYWIFRSKNYIMPYSEIVIDLYNCTKEDPKFYIKVESDDKLLINGAKIIEKNRHFIRLKWVGIIKLGEVTVTVLDNKKAIIDKPKKENLAQLINKNVVAYKIDHTNIISSNIKVNNLDNISSTEKLNDINLVETSSLSEGTMIFNLDNSKLFHIIIKEISKASERIIFQYLGKPEKYLPVKLSDNILIFAIKIDSFSNAKKLDYIIE